MAAAPAPPARRSGLSRVLRRIGRGGRLLLALAALAPPLAAGGETRRPFNIPPGDASETLKTFSRQSGRGVIFPTDGVRHIMTNAVTGELTVGEALDRLLAQTPLVSAIEPQTGAFAIRRIREPRITRTPVRAPVARATRPAAAADEILELSKFEVNTTQDKGYVAANTATGLKTRQELMRIPQSVTVVTRDLIDDIGSANTSDILQFAGASQFYRGESVRLRGARILNPYIDDAIDNTPYMDNVHIDSYEIIRGPAGVLYANSSVGGVVLKATKKPLPYARRTLSFAVDRWGLYRGEFDFTGPLAEIGQARLSYRLVGARQDGDVFFRNVTDRHTAIHPTLQLDLGKTTVRAAFDYQDLHQVSHGMSIIQPDGRLFTGAGRDEGNYPRNAMERQVRRQARFTLLHRFSPHWEARLFATHLDYRRRASVLLNNSVDFANSTLTVTARRNHVQFDHWILNQDVLGTYRLAGLEHQSAFGCTLTDEVSRFANTPDSEFGYRTLSLFQPDFDSLELRRYESYLSAYPLDRHGSRTNNRRSTFYYAHQATVIPERLLLVGGVTRAALHVNDIPNFADRSTVRVVRYRDWLHRIGAVFNLTDSVALYTLSSTTFSPQGNNNTRDYYGNLLPAQQGRGREWGLKTAFADGRLSATVSWFDMELTHVPVGGAGLSPLTGLSYATPDGVQRQRGVDGTLSLHLLPAWQLLVTGFQGRVRDQFGETPNGTYSRHFSFFTRYDFSAGAWNGLSLGGGASRTGGNVILVTESYGLPAGSTQRFVEIKPVWNTVAFASYRFPARWSVRLSVTNVLNQAYLLGSQGLLGGDPSPPRTFQLSTTCTF
ncbi:MAG: TonB-dependent receptor [Opitutaceae bacterium]|nr:TonB-dependent receptor [Opitutaceae bacterium]